MNKVFPYLLVSAILALLLCHPFVSEAKAGNLISLKYLLEFQQPDSTVQQPETRFPAIDKESNNPFLAPTQSKAMQLPQTENMQYTTEYDPKTGEVHLYKRIGNMNVKLPYTMTLEEYMDEDVRKSMLSYWEERSRTVDENGKFSIFNPSFKIGGDGLESIFGSNLINIKPQGIAELQIGVNRTTIDNPTLQENLRKTTTFDFKEKIQMNIQGNIGDKVKLGINYNTEATFEFDNQMKLEYEGKEDDIIQSIEAGDVSLPLPGTLITGSQSLFGVKTEMQFGKLNVTSVFSQQRGETSVLDIQGGAQNQEFEIAINDYDKNRHFFLSNYFRDLYNEAQKNYPINSRISIQKIEVWVTNTSGNFDDARNIIGFMDIGETGSNVHNPVLWGGTVGAPPNNNANNLYNDMNSTYAAARDINQTSSTLQSLSNQDFINGQDYEKIENARLLSASEYTLNSRLGFISLNMSLNADEVLAVAFEYDYNGETYRVGEFSSAGIDAPNALYLKLLKSTNLTPKVKPTWDLMMKNIYSIGAYQVNKEDFIFEVVYVDDSTGAYINYFPDNEPFSNDSIPLLLRIMDLDKLNDILDPIPDGAFDFIEDQTIYPDNGRVIFPVLEPFGSHLNNKLKGYPDLQDKYVYQALYDSTQTSATQNTEKNKFWLKGSYKSSSSSDISLNAQNIPQGSVVVTAGGIKLTENVDYTVDYSFGTIKIINQGLLSSGTAIQVSLESQSLFNLQTKTLMGTHMNYQFNKDFNIGTTIMHMRETPLTQKVNIGDEPIANTIYGFNMSYFTESQWITNALNKIPLLQVKEPSSVSFEGEYAQLIPGHSSVLNKNGEAYIDDFEGTKISIDVSNWTAWGLASAPQGQDDIIPNADLINDLTYGYNRAKVAWYVIDPLFSRNNQYTPGHIKNDPDEQSNHFSRIVYEDELFPNKETAYGEPTYLSVLNLAYYPSERGPYNFDTNINKNGELENPETRWGGIQRSVETNDFEAANIEYIEFWMMDPFVYSGDDPSKAGDLYFNLGNVSEDVLKDSRKFFEQGMPGPDEPFNVDSTAWGYIPTKQSSVNAFSNESDVRIRQDIGLDGLNSEQERVFYTDFINTVGNMLSMGNLTTEAYETIMNDPSSDDYHYFRGSDYDQDEVNILDRYKNYNSPEGNSVPSEYSDESYATASTSLPDQEDINKDNTLSENESYYQYKVRLDPMEMQVGSNYITDIVETDVPLKNDKNEHIKWYQFRIPISIPDKKVGNINDFSSIRFMRMFLHGFSDTTILRFATLDLVRSEWRKYTNNLTEYGENDYTNNENEITKFEIGAVNIEENAERQPIKYDLPPGIDRVIDPANPQLLQLNEQSLSVKLTDLRTDDRRAVYKTMNMDFRQYGHLEMEVHAEELVEGSIGNNKVRAFIRIGTDTKNNYYEYEVPLEMTPHNDVLSKEEIWPENNRFDFDLEKFTSVKLQRDQSGESTGNVYPVRDGSNWVKIKGNPSLSNVRTIMLGVHNMADENASFEIWFNELRLSDFNEEGGWAANARMNIKLSDLGNISLAGNTSTIGYGSIDQTVSERSQEDYYQYSIATNLELGKLTGAKSRLSIPFYYSYSEEVATPEYYLDTDITLDQALDNAKNSSEKDSLKNIAQDVVKQKSINFTNVRLKPKSNQSKIYDVSNLSATYSYNETTAHNTNTQNSIDKDYRGVLAYNFNNKPKAIEPFKKSKILKPQAFKLIKDFNFYLMPTQISYRTEMIRNYYETQLRNLNNPQYKIPLTISKDFSWNRYFDLRYNLTKSLKFDFKSVTNARIDEPIGRVNKDDKDEYKLWKDSVMANIRKGGRVTNYQHNFNVSYNIPINKIPYLNWTNATLRYSGMYNWETPSQSTDESIQWGNTIRNSNNIQASGQLNLTTLYNRSKYLKGLSRKYNNRNKQQQKNKKRTVRYNKEGIDLEKGKSYIINHKLKTANVRVRMFDENGRTARGKVEPINESKAEFIPEADYKNARVMVTGTVEDKTTVMNTIMDYSAMLATGIKNISLNYTETNGTILPGYLPSSQFLGTSTYNGFKAPGYGFIAGWQDRNFARKAAERGWITADTINQAYVMTHQEDFTFKTTIEPIKGLRIDLTANRRYANNMNEYYFMEGNSFTAFNTRESGNFSMTFNMFNTAFDKVSKTGTYESSAYNQFLANREIIANRLAQNRVGLTDPNTDELYDPSSDKKGTNGYSLTSQEVLIPAFLSAYSGKDADNIFLNLIPNVLKMQPNWRITYDGLSKIKPLKKIIRSFDVSHSYSSTYTVGSFVTNSDYDKSGISWVRDLQDNFVSQHEVNSVTLSETFSPLIAFNITWRNNMTTKIETKKSRTLNLSLSNNQLIENYNDEFIIGLGYRFDKMDMILGSKAGQKKMSSDLDLKVDISLRDNIAIIRKIEEGVNQLTSGQKITTLKFTADYVLSDRFNMQLFYDRTVNSPYISLSYPTKNSNFGVSFRFSLTQ